MAIADMYQRAEHIEDDGRKAESTVGFSAGKSFRIVHDGVSALMLGRGMVGPVVRSGSDSMQLRHCHDTNRGNTRIRRDVVRARAINHEAAVGLRATY